MRETQGLVVLQLGGEGELCRKCFMESTQYLVEKFFYVLAELIMHAFFKYL